MNKRISELTEALALATGDWFSVVDSANNVSKKISMATLRSILSGTAVGDVKTSALSEEQFNAENWGTWKLLNGQSCAGTRLQTLTGWANVPDATTNGAFIRQAKTGRNIGTFETDDFKSHTHLQNPHTHTQNAHTHVQDAHDHDVTGTYGINQAANYAGFGSGSYVECGQTAGTVYTKDIIGGVHLRTPTNQYSTAVNQNTTAVNQSTGGAETRPSNLAFNLYIRVN